MAFFQPWLELSFGAIPFFTILGFAILYCNKKAIANTNISR